MKITNILHLSDFHFGVQKSTRPTKKYPGISPRLYNEVATECFPLFLREISRHVEGSISAICFTGDFGWKHDLTSLQEGINFLSKLAEDLNVPSDHVIVSPGNHDLSKKGKVGKQFEQFETKCHKAGFTVPINNELGMININNIPFIALNSCLGGTANIVQGLPSTFWADELKKIESLEKDLDARDVIKKVHSDMQYQFAAMNIPTIGKNQIEQTIKILQKSQGNCQVLLLHNNPLPTSIIDVRPYSNIVDAGALLYNLLFGSWNSIILHGHTHSKAGLNINTYQQDDEGCFVFSIGTQGFYDQTNAAVNVIRIVTTDTNEFIKCIVFCLVRNHTYLEKRFEYSIPKRIGVKTPEWNLEGLELTRNYTFDEVKKLKNPNAKDDEFALDLVYFSPNVIKIMGIDQELKQWIIRRNI
jgi:hypothetical protein